MSRKEKRGEGHQLQLVSALLAGVLLAFGVSVLLLFLAARLMASEVLGETAVNWTEGVASAVGCLCGGLYTALNCRRRMLLLGALTGALFYTAWTVVGLIGYAGGDVLDGVRNLLAALAGGITAGLACAWLRSGRK